MRMKKPLIDNKNIFKNAIVTYNNGEKEIFDVIVITRKGIYTGYVKLNKDLDEEFIDDGLISKENIQKIIVLEKEGISKEIDFKP
jgi:hypothetical protein